MDLHMTCRAFLRWHCQGSNRFAATFRVILVPCHTRRIGESMLVPLEKVYFLTFLLHFVLSSDRQLMMTTRL